MAVTDLTGTTWVFNNSINVSTDFWYGITFNSAGDDYSITYTAIYTQNNGLNYNFWGPTTVYENGAWYDSAWKTIEITGGSDASDSTLISWLQANAVQQGGSDGVTITYNGETISTITQDGTTTLPTNGKCMATDVVVSGNNVSSATIAYNGNIIATGTGTFTKTLQCANKMMVSNVTVTVVISSDIIYTFENGELTISNAPYEFSGGELTI